ncbi:MAG: B12-binding domain-containing radical SAM protein [Nitrospiraceae bacterium]|nr:B12-binding domain-containing radical SAM protein [Nitrospiraceae bacterium]
MHVTLIFPGIALPGFDSFNKKRTIDANFIDHGLASLSAAAKARGYSVDLIDLRALRDWTHFREEVKKRTTTVWGITSWSLHYPDVVRAVRILKEEREEAVVVLGGVHATIQTQQVAANALIDHIITQEGEITFVKLLDALSEGKRPDRILIGEGPELDDIPWVDRDLFDMTGELATPMVPGLPTPFVTTNAGRGCPFKCNFCQPAERAVFGNRVKMRSQRNVVEELLYLKSRFHFRSWMAHDDLFFINHRWSREFCVQYTKAGFTEPFVCQMRADLMCRYPDVVKQMAESGLAWAMIGFESGSQRILDMFQKETTVEENIRAAAICKEYGIKVWANVMFGAPTETPAEVLDTVRMVWKIKPDHLSSSYFTPTPGSGMAEEVEKKGLTMVDPYNSSCRTPNEAKMKDVDYDWLNQAIALAYEGGSEERLLALAQLPARTKETSCASH